MDNPELLSIRKRAFDEVNPQFPIRNLLVVVGPTAVGKTELCIRLAEHFGTAIVSADSRQFFREMNIGTAKPTPAERRGIVHHFVDSHSITEDYNAGAFERDALNLLQNQLFPVHPTVILTGGSTLYVKILTDGMDEIPDADPAIRPQLQARLEKEGLPPLLAQLDALDPAYGQTVDRANPQRVIRALEVCLSAGRPYSSFRQNRRAERPFRMIKIGLTRDRTELYARINARVTQMLAQGLVDEVRSLRPYRHHNALQTVGYSEVFDYLDGACDYAEMERLLMRNTRRYAKRQLTWFERDPDYRWFHPDQWTDIVQYIESRRNA